MAGKQFGQKILSKTNKSNQTTNLRYFTLADEMSRLGTSCPIIKVLATLHKHVILSCFLSFVNCQIVQSLEPHHHYHYPL